MGATASIFAKLVLDATEYTKGLNKSKTDTAAMTKTGSTGLGSLSTAFQSLTGFSLSAAGAIGIAGVALQKTAKYMIECEQAAVESAKADAKLEAVLTSTGQQAGMSSDELQNLAQQISVTAGLDDELVTSAEAVLLTFTKISDEVFPATMQAAADMSAVLGQDLQSSVTMIGKAMNDFSGYTALKRAGVSFTEEQIAQIKNFKESGDLISYQNLLLEELQTEYGGAAAAINAAGDGSENLKISSENLKETIGSLLIPVVRDWNFAQTELNNSIDTAIKLQTGEINKQKYVADAYKKTIAEVDSNTNSYEEYLVAAVKKAEADGTYADWMMSDGNRATLTQLEGGKKITELNFLQAASISQLMSRINGLSQEQYNLVFSYTSSASSAEIASDRYDKMSGAIQGVGEAAVLTEEELKAASDALEAMYKNITSLGQNLTKSDEELLVAETDLAEYIKNNPLDTAGITERTTKVQELKDEQQLMVDQWMTNVFYDMAMADSEMSQREFDFLMQYQVDTGQISQENADRATSYWEQAQEIFAANTAIQESVDSLHGTDIVNTVTTYYNSVHTDYGSGTAVNNNVNNIKGQALGGVTVAGTMYEVAEGGKPELYSEAGKTYLMTGSNGGIVTPAKSGSSGYQGPTAKEIGREAGNAMAVKLQQLGVI